MSWIDAGAIGQQMLRQHKTNINRIQAAYNLLQKNDQIRNETKTLTASRRSKKRKEKKYNSYMLFSYENHAEEEFNQQH